MGTPANLNAAIQVLRTIRDEEKRRLVDQWLVTTLHDEGYVDLPMSDSEKLAAMMRCGDIIRRGVEEGMDREKMASVRDYAQQMHEALQGRLSHDEHVIRAFQRGYEETGCEVFLVMQRVQTEMYEIMVHAERSVRDGIQRLDAALSR